MVVVVIVLGLGLAIYLLRGIRRRHSNPKYIPTSVLKNLWTKWEPGKTHSRLPDSDGLEPHRQSSVPTTTSSIRSPSPAMNAVVPRVRPEGEGGITTQERVDRHTSVRSVMTLPAYHQNPLQNEQVLGREGERGGVDVVIEFPEGADEEEAAREAEMEALYQVRLARRRENEEREERRRLKREARERGDFVALRELQARSRAPSSSSAAPTVEEARAEHDRIKKERQRAISSVSYADLGVARHDGTRLRANSNDSERDGLLGNAASMGSGPYHRRERSGSSVLSLDTVNTEVASGRLPRSRRGSALSDRPEASVRQPSAHSRAGTPSQDGRAGSSPERIEDDDIPPNSPPGYENISLDTPHDGHRTEPPPGYSSASTPNANPRAASAGTAAVAAVARPTAVTVDSEGRRTSPSHVGQMMLERMPSNSSISSVPVSARTAPEEPLTSDGASGDAEAPLLPTLSLPALPSIQIDLASPSRYSLHRPEE